MKVRNDFVTNSSSSSFIVAYKDLPDIDAETIQKYPFLKNYKDALSELIFGSSGGWDTDEGMIFENVESLRDYIISDYGCPGMSLEDVLAEDEFAKAIYEFAKDKFRDGYKILRKNIGYDDEIRADLFRNIQSDDFILMEE